MEIPSSYDKGIVVSLWLCMLFPKALSFGTVNSFARSMRPPSTSLFESHSSPGSSTLSTPAPITRHTNGDANGEANGANDASTSPSSSTGTSSLSFDNFDYMTHWYPVTFSRDLPMNQPTKVTLFDVDYVIAKTSDEEVISMLDICPHKYAALSEGRITQSGSFQCAYHGWTFDSKSGECIDIPQVEQRRTTKHLNSKMLDIKRSKNIDKADGTAVPAMIHQGLVWIFPGGGLEEALLAPPPPSVPELENVEYRFVSESIRDFPDIDWTILLENIMDPDHGLFAHQASAFDLYSASRNNPMRIQEEVINDGKGWKITSITDAIYKVVPRGNSKVQEKEDKTKKKINGISKGTNTDDDDGDDSDNLPPQATTTFIAPNLVYMGRRDPKTNKTAFVTAFWICPTGTGKARFMAGAISTIPKWINIPRWISHINLNNFLDQDTYLLTNQNRYVLATESQLAIQNSDNDAESKQKISLPVRKQLYNYRSPSERLGGRVGKFFDSTVSRVPNRLNKIMHMGGYNKVINEQDVPSREVVLDRFKQHTAICPESMSCVKNCRLIQKLSKFTFVLSILNKVLGLGGTSTTTITSTTHAAAAMINLSKSSTILNGLVSFAKNTLSYFNNPKSLITIWIISAMSYYVAKKIEKEFYFKYTNEYRNRDLAKIPSVWEDIVR